MRYNAKYLTTIQNTELGLKLIDMIREDGKKNGYRIRTYGRCHDRRQAFLNTGRTYYSGRSNSNSIYSTKSPEAKYCYGWAVYTLTKET